MDQPLFARQAWISACHFRSDEPNVLDRITDKIKESVHLDTKPFVLFDLDSTLYEVSKRTVRIFKDALDHLKQDPLPAPVHRAIDRLQSDLAGYSVEDTWANLGLCLKNPELGAARESLQAFWRERFFSNEYLNYDEPYPGTSDFACKVHKLGAELVYLTGRDAPRMQEGTLKILERDGFPLGERTQLRMKSHRDQDDVQHKVSTALSFNELGKVVASFENEPCNFVALFRALPQAIHVFVDTVCSDKPAEAIQGAYRLQRFRQT